MAARWNVTDDFTAKFSAEHSSKDTSGTAIQLTAWKDADKKAAGDPDNLENGKVDFNRTSPQGVPEESSISADNFSLNLEWLLGDYSLTATTGYSEYEFEQGVISAPVPVHSGLLMATEDYDQFYQEIRLASPVGEEFEYITGLSYYKQNLTVNQGIDILGLGGTRNELDQETESLAAFAQLTYHITDDVSVLVGARYSNVEKKGTNVIGTGAIGSALSGYDFDQNSFYMLGSLAGYYSGWLNPADAGTFLGSLFSTGVGIQNTVYGPTTSQRKVKLSGIDPSVSIKWKINSDVSTYFTYAEGSKIGGFDDQDKSGNVAENGFTGSADVLTYQEEEATNYEVGIKVSADSWRLNTALFFTQFDNLQVSQNVPVSADISTIRTSNAGEVEAKGLEIEGVFLVSDTVEVGGDITFLDSEYVDFVGAGCPQAPSTVVGCDVFTSNAKGRKTELAADVVGSFYVEWRDEITDSLELTIKARAYYNDGYTLVADGDPLDVQDSFSTYSLLAKLEDFDGIWSVSLQGKNLTDEAYLIQGGDDGLGYGHNGLVAPGRQIFLNATYNF